MLEQQVIDSKPEWPTVILIIVQNVWVTINDINMFTDLQSIADRLAFKQLFSFLKLISTTIC